jgi:hypothetical protein
MVKVIELRGVSLDRGNVVSDQFGCRIELYLSTAEDKDVSAFCDERLRPRSRGGLGRESRGPPPPQPSGDSLKGASRT